jgi:hypothetical protein
MRGVGKGKRAITASNQSQPMRRFRWLRRRRQSNQMVRQHSPGIRRALKAHHEVVGVTHDRHSAARMTSSPLMDPEINGVMQENVGEQRTDARTLRRSWLRLVPLIALQDAGLEPHPDEPEEARIGDPMGQHPQHPSVVNRVEEAADVDCSKSPPRP